MRKKLIKWSVMVCMVAALLLFLRWKLPAKQDVSLAETSLAATDDLVVSYRDGQNSLMFRCRRESRICPIWRQRPIKTARCG